MCSGDSFGRLDEDDEPVGAEPARQARALRTSEPPRGEADDRQTITRLREPAAATLSADRTAPATTGRALAALEALGHLAQRELAQVSEVLLLEEVLQRPGDLVGRVDLPGAQPLVQVLDGQVQVDDLVGLLEEAVGDRLAHRHAGRALDQVVQALQVLDVHRADDVDARVEQLEDVLVPLLVVAARDVRVRELVDDRQRRIAPQDRVEVHLLDGDAAVFDLRRGTTSRPSISASVSCAPVRLDEADHHVDAALLERVRLLQHAVGLADAGGEADVELEPAALPLLDQLQEVLRRGRLAVWSGIGVARDSTSRARSTIKTRAAGARRCTDMHRMATASNGGRNGSSALASPPAAPSGRRAALSAIVMGGAARGHRGATGGGRPPAKAARSGSFRRHSGTASTSARWRT